MRIDRCVCFDVTFARLREVARRTDARTVPELQACVAFGQRCGRCRPYVARMLETGEVVFTQVIGVPETTS